MTAGKTLTIHGADIENRDEKGHKTVKEEEIYRPLEER